jgi:hypothetical protein
MAVEKSAIQGFTETWDKTASWAQAQGISSKSYYPVYQMDSARLLAGETPMSTAERTRAILAAANPNHVTPVPGDKPNPTNIWGNTVSDLRSIFTGLAPNHLVANVYDTVKNAVLHPSTWVKPLEDIGTGHVKEGLELAAGVTGPGSILSWLPGVYVAGEIAQGGVGEALAHPVVSFLDLAPFAPAGKLLTAGADASRVAQLADKVGMTPETIRDASVPGLAKSFILSRKVADLPGALKDRAPSLVDATGKPVTIGDALNTWITSNTGMGKTLSALMKGMLTINDKGTDYEMALMRPAEMAMQALKPEEQEQVDALLTKKDPRAQGKTVAQIAGDSSIDPKIRTAYRAMEDVRQWVSDEALGSGADVARARPDGTTAIYHTAGGTSEVETAAKSLDTAKDHLIKAMEPNNKLAVKMREWDAQGAQLFSRFGKTWAKASEQAKLIDGKERFHSVVIDEGERKFGKPKPQSVTIDIRQQAEELFGSWGPGAKTSGEDGIMGRLSDTMEAKDFTGMKELSAIALRRLSGNGVHSIDASIDPSFAMLKQQVESIHRYATERVADDAKFRDNMLASHKRGEFKAGSIRAELREYNRAYRAYGRAVWSHPTADWVDMVQQKFYENLVKEEETYEHMGKMSAVLRRSDWAKEQIDRLHRDPQKLAQIIMIETEAAMSSPIAEQIVYPEDAQAMMKSAIDETNKLRQSGHEVVYIPSISTLNVRDRLAGEGKYGVHLNTSGQVRRSSRAFERKASASVAKRYDVTASLHLAAKEALQIDGTIEYASRILGPHMVDGGTAWETIKREFSDEIAGFNPADQTGKDKVEQIMADNFKMVKFNPQATFGFVPPSWSSGDHYIPEGIAKALPKMLDKGQFPLDSWYSKITNTFRFSILGLSPRYTAHVAFGGTFLLALRSSPRVLTAIPEAWRIIHNEGDVPKDHFTGATQRGIDPVVYRSFAKDMRNQGSQVFHRAAGAMAARWLSEEHIVKVQRMDLDKANPINWLKAVGDLNYKFTNTVSSFQRAAAYVDEFNKLSKKGFKDPVTGEVTHLSKERAGELAMEHSLKVMGDLKAMTPLERNWFTLAMPFYGWTKHILQYVGTYPADHPFRAQFLSVLAEQNTNDVASGLPKRLQFLLFLGSPDAEGNVTAVDARSFDPLRDVANYATAAGFISALNPIITAPLTMIDPSIIFGGVPLYPNVTYDQFYGIEDAGSQGSPLSALEQVVPQVSALDTALNLSGQYRKLASTNPNQFAKDIFGALNIPFLQVQHLNLKQIAAKDEIDRYHVASTAASNAFQSGNFSEIASLASVPDPENADYDISPAALSGLYNQLLQEYPGQAPSETATPPPPLQL